MLSFLHLEEQSKSQTALVFHKREDDMTNIGLKHRFTLSVVFAALAVFAFAGCSGGSSSNGGDDGVDAGACTRLHRERMRKQRLWKQLRHLCIGV